MDAHGRDKILPFYDGEPATLVKGKGNLTGAYWSEVQDGDEIWLPVHGHKYSTDKVSWNVGFEAGNDVENTPRKKYTALTSWTADEFAGNLQTFLGDKTGLFLHYHLLACFGANNIAWFFKSFGSRLTAAMMSRDFRGKMYAYKGATGMLTSRTTQIGSSRTTAAPLFLRHRLKGKEGAPLGNFSSRDMVQEWALKP
jgi:hypothetical protein